MAVSQKDIDALTAALASGERQVTLGSQSIVYRSIAEIKAARDELLRIQAAENATSESKPRRKTWTLTFAGRGYR